MPDLQNFNKLEQGKQLTAVKNLIKGFPREDWDSMVRAVIVDKDDQERMLKELNEENE